MLLVPCSYDKLSYSDAVRNAKVHMSIKPYKVPEKTNLTRRGYEAKRANR